MNLSNVFQKLSPNTPILQATFGLERESLRINTEAVSLKRHTLKNWVLAVSIPISRQIIANLN